MEQVNSKEPMAHGIAAIALRCPMNELIRQWDKIRYFTMAAPFMKADIEAWWEGLGNDW